MRVRNATPSDSTSINELAGRLASQPLPAWRDAAPLIAKLDEAKDAYTNSLPDDHVVYVCEDEQGKIVGYAHAGMDADFFSGEPQTHLYYLVTAPEMEGRGIARRLMNEIETWARDLGAGGILLYVFAPNARARAVYTRAGFEEDMVKMVKPLARD